MGKSIHSKWKIKMRNIKRVRYGQKELARLKNMVASNKDVEMMDPQLVTVTDAKKIKEDAAKKQDSMDVDQQSTSTRDPHTMKDEHGQYPVWMGKRKIKNLKNKKKNKKNVW
ncbi:hypothetical protein LSH36_103g00016 [Paralvinella palmiformis]|uniref:Uncharacterized protein n=1 Tax=Paralvinella palmiformis TaxID=53620 RepID=A0AAD9JZH8_9ANNE|nr:hypothetical protein LSH36_103g00016 [Paralvinella palmiformis]